ncbi:MAG: NADAR family protein [Alphaproteobacteria bacterium]
MTQPPKKNLETPNMVLFLSSEFSQWYPSDFVSKEGLKFTYAEQYMMHAKAMLFGDTETAEKILAASTPDEQKKLGREIRNFDKDVWERHAQEIVYQGNYYKFTQNPHLWQVLEKTAGKQLVEAAHYDAIWGIGLRAEDPEAQDPAKWKGKNWLGDTLTRLRDNLTAQNFQPEFNDGNRFSFRMYAEKKQRWLYLTGEELARQFNAASQKEAVDSLTLIHPRDREFEDITLDFKGHGKITEKVDTFIARHSEEISLIQLMAEFPDMMDAVKRDPHMKRKYGL